MARILYASFDVLPAPKGASRHIEALVGALCRAGHEVELCAITDAPRFAGARVHSARGASGNFLARAGAFGEHVLAVAASGAYDVVHVRSIWEGLPVALWRRPGGPRLLYEVNGLPSIELPVHFPRLVNDPPLLARLRRQELTLLAAADALLTPSPVTARCLGELGVPAERIHVVPNGVDTRGFAPTGGASAPEVLYLGTFAPWQGLDTLLRAFARLAPPTRLRLVGPPGKGWARSLHRLAAELGVAERVLIQPPVAPALVPELIARARVCVAPLDGGARNVVQGCCPLKLLEYMACGKPVVASALPAIEALVTHGRDAWLVPPDDAPALAGALATVLADAELAARLGAAARTRAEALSWDASNARVLALYASLGASVS